MANLDYISHQTLVDANGTPYAGAKKRRPRGRGQCNPCECGNHLWAKTSRGGTTLVSPQDGEFLRAVNWCRTPRGYVFSHNKSGTIYLHRKILNDPAGLEVDHKNHNKADNRRDNLRVASRMQNGASRRKYTFPVSGYKGVRGHRRKWVARISVLGKEIHLGSFQSVTFAAHAYDVAAKHYFGEFAQLNFARAS